MTRPQRTLIDFIQLGNRQQNTINTNFKLSYRVNASNKVTFETINNRSINTPYNHQWSRQGFVKVTYDTVRAVGQPDTYTPRYGTWSPTKTDSTFQPVNMPDHVPTTDDRFNQETFVWTNQLSDKSVWSTRIANLNFDALTSVGRKQPWEYWIQSPNYWSGNVQFGTENNPYYATHGDVPQYVQRTQGIWTIKSDFSTRRWKQHTWKTGIDFKYDIVQNRSVNTSVVTKGSPDLQPETNIAYQAGVQHLFSRDVSGQFSVFFKDIYGLITQRQVSDEFGNLVNQYSNGDYASSRGFEMSLIKSFRHN